MTEGAGVRDAGIGIEPAMLPRIFDLFLQVKARRTGPSDGLGIGLALVRMLSIGRRFGAGRECGSGPRHRTGVSLPLLKDSRAGNPAAPSRPRSDVMDLRDESSSSTTTGMRPTAWQRCCDWAATK